MFSWRVSTTLELFDGEKWWYFAMGYGLCPDTGTINGCDACGGSWNNTVGVWSNTALRNEGWAKAGEVMPVATRPARANCTWYRSHGVYSRFTKKWVVWINAQHCADCLPGQPACYITATADSPAGPEWKPAPGIEPGTSLGSMQIPR